MSFETLPDSTVLYISQYLNLQDLISFSLVSQNINKILSQYETSVWRPLCGRYWLLKSLPEECKSWKSAFISQYKKFGECMDCYSEVKELWTKFENWLSEKCPPLLAALQGGIDKNKMNSLLKDKNVKLSNALKCSYLIHNGQNFEGLNIYYGVFGNVENNYNITLADFETALSHSRFAVNVKKMYNYNGEILPEFYPFVSIDTDGSVAVCLMGKLQNVANSFLEWFCRYVDDVVNGRYPIDKEEIIPYHSSTEVSMDSGYFTVKVRWLHLLHQSGRTQGANYSYRITMSMDKNAPESQSCRLSTRHWVVTEGENDSGHPYVTWGTGVVGEYPVMTPGAEYTWISYNSFPTVVGSMEGHFVMRLLSDYDTEIEVSCPKFTMKPFYNGEYLPYEIVKEEE